MGGGGRDSAGIDVFSWRVGVWVRDPNSVVMASVAGDCKLNQERQVLIAVRCLNLQCSNRRRVSSQEPWRAP